MDFENDWQFYAPPPARLAGKRPDSNHILQNVGINISVLVIA